ncbi:hypothetical protein [Caballeronia sp. LZ001]|uniref:hypothetical protein n=1 Tax=Caballeronia sp. LZ001 TaxID=3038553 RepID=UPI002855820C|nr:hypothetical protein [Caballeronia sp. LZ001]MDR5801190.1 hypothetical protein [Caballeronia sp. LZ001]
MKTLMAIEAKAYAKERSLPCPMTAFRQQRASAARRGIGWKMSFDEWWMIWRDWYHMRGRGKNQLCMARQGDVGPYASDNVYLTTCLGNQLDVDRSYAKGPRKRMTDDERIARQQKKDRWGGQWKGNDRASHMAYKSHCRGIEDEAESRSWPELRPE